MKHKSKNAISKYVPPEEDVRLKCAEVLKREQGFNPRLILGDFYVIGCPDYPEHLKYLPPDLSPEKEEWENWHYLGFENFVLAILFNDKTEKYRLIKRIEDPELKGWTEEEKASYRETDEEIERWSKEYDKKIEEIQNSEIFKKLAPLVRAYKAIPLRERIHLESPEEYLQNLLRKPPYNFDESKVKEWTENIFLVFGYNADYRKSV